MRIISMFNHKGGVGKTTTLFNCAIEMGRLGKRVLMVDLDAQANLTAVSISETALDELYRDGSPSMTVADALAPLVSGSGDILDPGAISIRSNHVWLLAGDIRLSQFEGIMPQGWTEALAGNERGFRVTTAPLRMIEQVADNLDVDYVLVDLGPNVGPLNRAVLLASDYIMIPMSADLFSLRALPSVGASLTTWIKQWSTALTVAPTVTFNLPEGKPKVLGHVSQQFGIYNGTPTKSFRQWIDKIPKVVEDGLLIPLDAFSDSSGTPLSAVVRAHGSSMGVLKNYHSLVPYAQTQRKAIFELEKDSVIFGQQFDRAKATEDDFKELCEQIFMRAT
ncbi:AAA family ATPase [Rhodococcus hoagii]|nr:AAA family ATPase [Prescottella equi]MBM4527425.1 AAA family ATPase [Prescottella equi]MBM4546877.1 AAA family ATPase [Prescottella equi]MBM4573698.1 AAA family ATPase [Prescottella equi]MBM4602665.1 AAA family ATPase [Prescottella equi]